MTIKWNRESFLVILTALMILIGLFYYGNLYIVQPIKEEADGLTDTVKNQQALLESYQPNEETLLAYEESYQETEVFLPRGVQVTDELVILEQLAEQSEVTILTVARSEEQQAIEEVSEDYAKDIYTVQMESGSSENFRQLINRIMNEERVWNISSFSYEKIDEENYTGTFNFELYYQKDLNT